MTNLSTPTAENMEFMIEDITKRLKMAAVAALRPSHSTSYNTRILKTSMI